MRVAAATRVARAEGAAWKRPAAPDEPDPGGGGGGGGGGGAGIRVLPLVRPVDTAARAAAAAATQASAARGADGAGVAAGAGAARVGVANLGRAARNQGAVTMEASAAASAPGLDAAVRPGAGAGAGAAATAWRGRTGAAPVKPAVRSTGVQPEAGALPQWSDQPVGMRADTAVVRPSVVDAASWASMVRMLDAERAPGDREADAEVAAHLACGGAQRTHEPGPAPRRGGKSPLAMYEWRTGAMGAGAAQGP